MGGNPAGPLNSYIWPGRLQFFAVLSLKAYKGVMGMELVSLTPLLLEFPLEDGSKCRAIFQQRGD